MTGINESLNDISVKLAKQFDDMVIEGLKIKGFEFDTILELTEFIKSNCSSVDYQDKKERIYYVDGVPFLVHKYEPIVDVEPKITDDKISMTATFGSFAYL